MIVHLNLCMLCGKIKQPSVTSCPFTHLGVSQVQMCCFQCTDAVFTTAEQIPVIVHIVLWLCGRKAVNTQLFKDSPRHVKVFSLHVISRDEGVGTLMSDSEKWSRSIETEINQTLACNSSRLFI